MTPILYSFRRCPYAMRARLAIAVSGITVELREILLRDKAPEFLAASPKGTVPVVLAPDVIEESRDVMLWALAQNDPEGWLAMPDAGQALIDTADGPFKSALDRTKYQSRYPEADGVIAREQACTFLRALNAQLSDAYLFGPTPTLADMALLPFVRQFANIDKAWFDAQPWSNLSRWLEAFVASDRFASIMTKYPKWQAGDPPLYFKGQG